MGNSLQDQLLKAGLIDQKKIDQARKAEKQKATQRHKPKKTKAPRAAKPALTPEQLEKQARDRELEQQRAEVRRQREVAAEVRQLVRGHRHPRTPGDDDVPFNFQNKDKVKRIFVSPDTHKLITAGRLVIVNDNGVFELVPPPIAEKIRQRNPSLVIDLPEDKGPDADDPYAQYQVPDDLIW